MSSQPEPLPSEIPIDLRWLRTVRGFALASLLEILLSMCMVIVFGMASKEADPAIFFGVLFFAPVCFPYAWVYWRLRSKTGKTVKKSLAMSIGFGVFALLFSSFMWLSIPNIGDVWQSNLVIGVFALLQLALIVSAMKAYYVMPREPRDYRILLPGLALGAFVLVLCIAAVLLPNLDITRDRHAADEASAVASLRTINAAQLSYAEKHPEKGFAAALVELGPPPGAGLIDTTLSNGRKNGYIFTMIASARDSDGKITKYSVKAALKLTIKPGHAVSLAMNGTPSATLPTTAFPLPRIPGSSRPETSQLLTKRWFVESRATRKVLIGESPVRIADNPFNRERTTRHKGIRALDSERVPYRS